MSHHRFHSSAPFGIKALAAVTAADGLVSVAEGLGQLAGGTWLLAALLCLAGLANLGLAYGLWQLEPYAYVLGMGLFGAGAVLDLLAGSVVGAMLSSTTLAMLYHYRDLYGR